MRPSETDCVEEWLCSRALSVLAEGASVLPATLFSVVHGLRDDGK